MAKTHAFPQNIYTVVAFVARYDRNYEITGDYVTNAATTFLERRTLVIASYTVMKKSAGSGRQFPGFDYGGHGLLKDPDFDGIPEA